MEQAEEIAARGKNGTPDKQRLLADGALPSESSEHETLHSVSLDEITDSVKGNMQSDGQRAPGAPSNADVSRSSSADVSDSSSAAISTFPRQGSRGIQLTRLSIPEEDLEEDENHDGPLLDPKTQPVNKLPRQEEEFDSYLTGPVRTLVIGVTSTLTFVLLGSTVVLAVCLMPGMEGTIDTVAPIAASLLMLSLMGSLVWCCWLGWNQCWFAATKNNLIRRLPFTLLHMLKPDELVKVKGRIAVGPDGPLTASYSHQMNCVYTEACLYRQDPDAGGQANEKWGCDVAERRAVDFYLVDDETGRSVLVKAGYGAGITTIVPVTEVVETARGSAKRENKTPKLEAWLEERDKTSYLPGEPDTERRQEWLRFTESYLRAGDHVLVVGNTERRGDQIVVVPPDESLSYGCRFWFLCLLPFHLRGLIITNEGKMIGDLPKAMPVAAPEGSV
ncbi:hypothetical protein KFL_005490030 [Klebsormidium nitens]|uniref:Uncharacterized protein n=1 Tax=Klebsormidium nitens TaxID=105231 RepID=A0A1Y1IG97_KLENI|nr:hypothetical protein KFL_005490030 [Klebsormidium nitens]|eukprot:GAQ89673.1 hypothetical protein KFL_005490030 [Klebsormidium nitens]